MRLARGILVKSKTTLYQLTKTGESMPVEMAFSREPYFLVKPVCPCELTTSADWGGRGNDVSGVRLTARSTAALSDSPWQW